MRRGALVAVAVAATVLLPVPAGAQNASASGAGLLLRAEGPAGGPFAFAAVERPCIPYQPPCTSGAVVAGGVSATIVCLEVSGHEAFFRARQGLRTFGGYAADIFPPRGEIGPCPCFMLDRFNLTEVVGPGPAGGLPDAGCLPTDLEDALRAGAFDVVGDVQVADPCEVMACPYRP